MFPSHNRLPKPRFGALRGGHLGGHLGFSTKVYYAQ